jgi:hypothetical protein
MAGISLNVTAEFNNVEDLAETILSTLDREETNELIFALDRMTADFEFTENVVNTMVNALRTDEPDWCPTVKIGCKTE